MKVFATIALAATAANAFPFVLNEVMTGKSQKRDYVSQPGCTTSSVCDNPPTFSDSEVNIPAKDNPATLLSKGRDNCGLLHAGECTTFSESQRVSTTGEHAYAAPGAYDIRGPCPGLNAAANHGYLPRSGIANIENSIVGLGELYGMSIDLAGFLAAYSVVFDGDVVSQTWSIGGPIPQTLLGTLGFVPTGDGYSHNNYEGDTSVSRCDAFMNGGDAHSSSPGRFKQIYESGTGNPWNDKDITYTFDTMARAYAKATHVSISTNPYYFAPLFSTTLVSPAAHNFVVTFMSNHSAEHPAGYLDGYNFKSFFAYTGEYPNMVWQPGQERVPDNWYRRPFGTEYNAVDVFGDLIPDFVAYPDTFRFGGNMDGVNTYTGIDIDDLTGGSYGLANLFDGDNFGCFFFQTEQQAIPLYLQGLVQDLSSALELMDKYLLPIAGKFTNCPTLSQYDNSVFTKYTGHDYKPAPATTGPVNC